MIVDTLPKPMALEGTVEREIRSESSTVQINRYRWNEPREAIFKTDTPIIDIVLARRSADLACSFLEAEALQPRLTGDIIFMPPNYTLHSRWDRGERRSMCCVMDPDALGEFFDIDWHDSKLEASLNIRNGFIRGIMLKLVTEALEPSFASGILVESLSTALAVELRRYFDIVDPEKALPERRLSTAQLSRVRDRLENEDASHPVTVAELARCEGMSVRHFSRLFRATAGKPVSDYAAEVRITRAKALLADESVLVKEIAFRCGFLSSSSFSSAFRRATSLTPQQFRSARLS